MDFRLGSAIIHHPSNEAASLVNLRPRAFDVGLALAGADKAELRL
jgi:hypothetical protein